MEQLFSFKKSLEQTCSIIEWNPSSPQLLKIAGLLATRRPARKSDADTVISQVCPGTRFLLTEGVDNSDLNTLLAMANQIANRKA